MRRALALLALALALAIAGCTQALSEPAGRYQGVGDWKQHSLVLETDGAFVHAWNDLHGPREEKGRWSISSRNEKAYKSEGDRCLYLDLQGYKVPDRSGDLAQACGIRDAEGDLLIINDSRALAYRKQ